jgi:16S rRNA (cytosine967-C5)-methyltransferase
VLVDPPCSGLGTVQSRPDLRWRANPEGISELAALQRRLLAAGAAATAPGGRLAYSVCTLSRAESRDVVESFLEAHPQFTLDDLSAEYAGHGDPHERRCLTLLPHRDGTDGFFVARFTRG